MYIPTKRCAATGAHVHNCGDRSPTVNTRGDRRGDYRRDDRRDDRASCIYYLMRLSLNTVDPSDSDSSPNFWKSCCNADRPGKKRGRREVTPGPRRLRSRSKI